MLKDIEEYKSKCEELLDTYKNKSVTTDQAFLQNTTLCKNLVNKNIESLKEALSDESNYLKPLAYFIHSEYYYDELKSEVMGGNDSVNQVDLI